jgi:hypothetical protein
VLVLVLVLVIEVTCCSCSSILVVVVVVIEAFLGLVIGLVVVVVVSGGRPLHLSSGSTVFKKYRNSLAQYPSHMLFSCSFSDPAAPLCIYSPLLQLLVIIQRRLAHSVCELFTRKANPNAVGKSSLDDYNELQE